MHSNLLRHKICTLDEGRIVNFRDFFEPLQQRHDISRVCGYQLPLACHANVKLPRPELAHLGQGALLTILKS